MFDISTIKVLHLEPTTKCNAVCPQCQRTIHADSLQQAELTLADVQDMFPIEFVKQLDKMFMCGNFGDPAAAKDTIAIFKWFKTVNPLITLGMNTNGGIRATSWWRDLATVFNNPKDAVIFSIDGLRDTNHIYRINVRWEKLIRNIKAFVGNKGNAHWDMLVFSHNEHQIQQAKELAKSLNMQWFRTKVSSRKINVDFLSLPMSFNLTTHPSTKVSCHALNERSLFVDAHGNAYPCCFIGNKKLQHNFVDDYLIPVDNINLRCCSISRVLTNYSHIFDALTDNPYPACVSSCSVQSGVTCFESQWKNNIQL